MIEAKVIRILSDTQLIINAGNADGVVPDMRFRIMGPGAEEIVDPETGMGLGALKNVKSTVVARSVYDRFTIAYTDERVEVQEPTPLGFFSRRKLVPRSFLVDHAEVQPLFGGDTAVHVGDSAVEVVPNKANVPA